MPRLTKHRDFQRVRNLPFCYLCGKPFASDDDCDYDHVVPEAIFAKSHRQTPLKLRTHTQCNAAESEKDEIIADLISMIHDPKKRRAKLKKLVRVARHDGELMGGFQGPLANSIGRFLRGFHAALYGEYLPYKTNSAILPPFPTWNELQKPGIQPQFFAFSEVLKKCRIAGCIDEIACYSGHCRYFCVWSRFDNGIPCCLFSLKIYEWEKLADTKHFPRRSCLGMYWTGSRPSVGTKETILAIPFTNFDPLDPFGD